MRPTRLAFAAPLLLLSLILPVPLLLLLAERVGAVARRLLHGRKRGQLLRRRLPGNARQRAEGLAHRLAPAP